MKTQRAGVPCLLLAVVLPVGASAVRRRRLQDLVQESFLWYEPLTTVTDYAAIDLDQLALEDELFHYNLQAAYTIYTEGAFSDSYAQLTLGEKLRTDVRAGTDVSGQTASARFVLGRVRTMARVNATLLEVQYHISPNPTEFGHSCFVGGNPSPKTEGCFAPSGMIEVDMLGTYTYKYDPFRDNRNQRTLQSFSVNAKETMFDCQFSNCPYPTYIKFYNYYGAHDYGNQFILASFQKSETKFTNGDADFSNLTDLERFSVIEKATILMNLWMEVIREMEHAVEICEFGKDTDDSFSSWDRAVAYYMGSVAKAAGGVGYTGHSLYTIAEHQCIFAKTCLTENIQGDAMDISKVNDDIFQQFKLGQGALLEQDCSAAKARLQKILAIMIIPLVQGVLRYAYQMQQFMARGSQEGAADGGIYAACLLPLIHSCSAPDALRLYHYMGLGNGHDMDYKAVKAILEQNYACLGIHCEDVGGIADEYGRYVDGGSPCGATLPTGDVPTTNNTTATTTPPDSGAIVTVTLGNSDGGSSSSTTTATSFSTGPDVGLALGLVCAAIVAGLSITFLAIRSGLGGRGDKEFDGPRQTVVERIHYDVED